MGLVYTDHWGRKWIAVNKVVKRYIKKKPLLSYLGDYYEYDFSKGIWRRIESLEKLRIRIARYAEEITNLSWGNQYKEEANEHIRVQVKEVDEMDSSMTKICLNNCVVDLATGEVSDFSPDECFTTRFDIDYDPKAKCPNTDKFLDQVSCGSENRKKSLVEFLGLGFTKVNCPQAVLLTGNGANGKSCYCNLLTELLGPENYTSITISELKAFGTGKLPGKRLAIMSEISKSDSENLMTTELKQIVTGEVMGGNVKYKQLFDFRPYAKVLILSNHMVGFSNDASVGVTRRLHVIPFELQLSESERDNRLLEKLLAEKSGIFNLAIQGYQRYVANGNIFSSSKESNDIIRGIMCKDNPIAEFVKEMIAFDSTSFVSYKKLRENYIKWCEGNAIEVSSPDGRLFMSEISKFGKVESRKSNGNRGIKGICLKL